MTVDEHIKQGNKCLYDSYSPGWTIEARMRYSAQASAHFAAASALIARYENWHRHGVVLGNYDGTQNG